MQEVGKTKLERYKEALPFGGQKEVAELAGVSRKSVCFFLKGIHESKRIEIAVLKVIAKHKREMDKLKKQAGFL